MHLDSVIDGMSDGVHYCGTGSLEWIVKALLDAGADVAPFLEPLERYPIQEFSALSALSGGMSFFLGGGLLNFSRKGASMYHIMEMYSRWLLIQGLDDCVLRFAIKRLLDRLKEKSNITIARPAFRFDVGTRIECDTGPDEWETGTIVRRSTKSHAYRVKLDDGEKVWAPVDADVCIALPEHMEH
ncbi:hypothetical protein ACHAWF_012626 [Thalassiosira exigua]